MNSINSIDALKLNIEHEKKIIKEILIFSNQLDGLRKLEEKGLEIDIKEKKLLTITINSLLNQLKILNKSIPEIIKKISFFKELPTASEKGGKKVSKTRKEKLISVSYKDSGKNEVFVTINKNDKLKFLKELNITDSSIRRLKKEYNILKEEDEEFKKPSKYARISNKFFSKISTSLFNKGYFSKLNSELRKANLYFLARTYISMALFSSLLAFLLSLGLLIVLLFFNLSLDFPFLISVEEPIFLRLVKNIWIIFAFPTLTFVAFYFYPSLERKSIASKINQELPFVVVHMSAIAGSGVEPTKIFKIIAKGKEYPNVKKEFKKLLNKINIYGYDIVNALKESAEVTSSKKLAELFKGLATTITSGGSLKEFLNKRAETLIFDYKIEREKYTHMAETFMDIYISVVIAAPMIMTILLVMISITDMGLGLSLQVLSLLMLLGISLINIFFLIFLHLKQPAF